MGPVTRTVGPGLLAAFVVLVEACGGTVVDRAEGHSDAGVPSSSGGAGGTMSHGAGGRIPTGGTTSDGAGGTLTIVGATGTGGEGPCAVIVSPVGPVLVDVDGSVSEEIPCMVRVPAPPDGFRGPILVNVAIGQAGLLTVTLIHVEDPRLCTENAWYYDDPAEPSQLILCPAACEHLHASPAAWLHLLFGCKTMSL